MDRITVQENHRWQSIHVILLRSVRLFPRVHTFNVIGLDQILQWSYELIFIEPARWTP